jgi:hypothetical protein
LGLKIGPGLGELTAAAGVDGTGEAARACDPMGLPQAHTSAISARPAHFMPVERALSLHRYCTP